MKPVECLHHHHYCLSTNMRHFISVKLIHHGAGVIQDSWQKWYTAGLSVCSTQSPPPLCNHCNLIYQQICGLSWGISTTLELRYFYNLKAEPSLQPLSLAISTTLKLSHLYKLWAQLSLQPWSWAISATFELSYVCNIRAQLSLQPWTSAISKTLDLSYLYNLGAQLSLKSWSSTISTTLDLKLIYLYHLA